MQYPPEVQLPKLGINRSRRSSPMAVRADPEAWEVRGPRSVGGQTTVETSESGLREGGEALCDGEPTERHG